MNTNTVGNHSNIWVFLAWLVAGLILISLIPGNYRYWAIAIIVLGGLGYAYHNNPNFAADIQSTLQPNKTNG